LEPSGKRKGEPKWWWRHIWPITATSYSVLIGAQCIVYLLGYINLSRLSHGILLTLASVPLVYAIWYLRTRISIDTQLKINRILFIGAGALSLGFVIFFCTGLVLHRLFNVPTTGLMFLIELISSYIIGGFIGDQLGKRRNYLVPYQLENEE